MRVTIADVEDASQTDRPHRADRPLMRDRQLRDFTLGTRIRRRLGDLTQKAMQRYISRDQTVVHDAPPPSYSNTSIIEQTCDIRQDVRMSWGQPPRGRRHAAVRMIQLCPARDAEAMADVANAIRRPRL
ncbi:hypothetical protein [Williamsia deligens]|uniref:Uncharacterized protein n=1 Tax=Williamsia deligens TaxID=321325 RepID=A0ABW3GCK7_9NOCA|nr:hypothetical protein [Williamsia deligens]